MELFSNLVWLAVSVLIVSVTLAAVRRRTTRVPAAAALCTAMVLCLLLLPVISMTDDLLESRQAALPLAAQSWHLASDAASVGLEAVLLLSACLLMLAVALTVRALLPQTLGWDIRPCTAWLTRAQRLRPPPSFAS